jgi:purine-binding chemotaxis protein CheW
MDTATAGATPGQYLTFTIADEEYGVGLRRVREIVEFGAVSRVPGTPSWIRGVVNLRGSVVAVVDLAVKFGLPPSPPTRFTCIVIMEVELDEEMVLMGFIADVVKDVVDLGPGDVEPPPPFGTRVQVEYVLGMGKLESRLAVLLDIQRVLSAAELLAATSLGEADAAAGEASAAPDDAR